MKTFIVKIFFWNFDFQIDAIEENILIDDEKKKSTDINITDEICKTSNWKCINSHNSTHSPEKSSSVKHRYFIFGHESCWGRRSLWYTELFGCANMRSLLLGLFRVEAIITIWNHDLVIMIMYWVYIYITSKWIEVESPGCSGFEENLKSFKTWPTGTF